MITLLCEWLCFLSLSDSGIMPVDFSHIALPIMEIVPQLREQLAVHTNVIVGSPPGAGKSTIVPLAILDEPWLQDRKIIMLEPRRLAASTIARRMAALLGEKAGQTVGYRVRFVKIGSASGMERGG